MWCYVLDVRWKQCWWCTDVLVIVEQYLWNVKAFSASHTSPPVNWLGMHRKLWDTAWTADPSWPKGCPRPYGIVLRNKSWEKREEGGECSELSCLSSKVTMTSGEALLFCRWLNVCLQHANSEWIPYFSLLVWSASALPIKLSLSQPTSFLTFTFSILSPILLWGEWAVWGWAAYRV